MLTDFTRNCWLAGISRYEFTYLLLQRVGLDEIGQAANTLRYFDELERIYQDALEKTRY